MVIDPLAWQEREYADGLGTVERWHIDFVDGRAYNCKRVSFSSVEAMQRAMQELELSAFLLETDRDASDAALSRSLAESTTTVGAFHSVEIAIAFFADGREPARQAAHDMIAAVDPRVEAFQV